MRPGESTTKRRIRKEHPKQFALADRFLAVIHGLHGLLCDRQVERRLWRPQVITHGLWIKICKQYRSIIVLCELGLVEDAEVIARSLFESVLQVVFIVKRGIRVERGWSNAPKPPTGGFSSGFRATLCVVRPIIQAHRKATHSQKKRGLRRVLRPILAATAGQVDLAKALLGMEWFEWLSNKGASKNAFSVETMAGNLGLARYYEVIYRWQSEIVHAADALNHLSLGEQAMSIDATIAADGSRAVDPLRLITGLVGFAAEAIDSRFRLGYNETLRELAREVQKVFN